MVPSYADLEQEDAWIDEYEPQGLRNLADALRSSVPGAQVWISGDNEHLRGYHRSRRWIKESIYCTNRSYSVTRTAGDVSGGDSNWVSAMDISVDQNTLHAMCRRLDEACRAGRLEKITEWYGNLGGDSTVDGWDNISNVPRSADSSHLTHLHLSFDRGRANDDHSDLLAVLTGDDMDAYHENAILYTDNRVAALVLGMDQVTGTSEAQQGAGDQVWPVQALKELLARPPVASAPVDIGALVDALTPVIRKIVREELDDTKLGGIA